MSKDCGELRVLLICEESAGAQVLNAVAHTRGSRIVAVMTSPETMTNGGVSLVRIAEEFGYDVWPARLVKDPEFAHEVTSARIDVILNVHSRYIIHEQLIRTPRIGSFNLHPGPLPEYAGLNTVSWAIYLGESSYGVTIHWMTQDIDAGDIAYETRFSIADDETPISLMHKCVLHGVSLAMRLLETAFLHPEAVPKVAQELQRRRYFGREIPQNGQLSWRAPAREIVNFVRACDYFPYSSPWGYPTVKLQDRDVAVAKAVRTYKQCDKTPGTVGHCDATGAWIATADEWVLIRQLKVAERFVRPQVFLRAGTEVR
jgi:methionyl-tRNA formyltransferase